MINLFVTNNNINPQGKGKKPKKVKTIHTASISLLIPDNLDIHAELKANPIKVKRGSKKIKVQADYACLIIHQLLNRGSLKKSINLASSSFFVPLNATILQSMVRDYNTYLNWLENQGIIEGDHKYKKGEFSRSYRLALKYRSKRMKEYEVSSRVVMKKLSKSGICPDTKRKYAALLNDLENLSINQPAALNHIHSKEMRQKATTEAWDDIRRTNKEKREKSPFHGLHKSQIRKVVRELNMNKRNSWEGAVNNLRYGNFYFKQDKTAFRLHTSAVSLKKDLRRHLRFKGDPLVACDISNSQPYFSVGLFTNPKKYWPIVESYIRPYQNTKLEWIYWHIKSIMTKSTKNPNLTHSTISYVDLVISGKFYEFMARKLTHMTQRTWSREEAKEEVMKTLFGPPKFKNLAGRRVMEMHFPDVLSLFTCINYGFTKTKSQRSNPKKSSGFPNALARILQRMESEAILNEICVELKKKHPEVPLFTLHDGIATTVGNQDLVKDTMERILKKNIGHKPRIVIEWEKWGIGRYPS